MTEMQNSRLERGAGRIEVNRVPYVVEKAVGVLKNFRHMILIGARAPVAFFAYPGFFLNINIKTPIILDILCLFT